IQSHILEKNIVAFALNPVMQEILVSNKLDGSLNSPPDTSLLASIESNVGINKANKAVTRNINLEKTASTYVLAINWTHDGSYKSTEVPSTAYVNYHRIFTDPDWQVESILIQGKSVLPEHQRIITTKNGDSYLETGFLVVVPEFENVTAAITLSSSTQKPLYFIKQAGIEPFELLFSQNISGKQEISTFLISQNTILPNSTP
ncbi:MAG: hypothetical protein WAU07_01855, partial [Microgenomates group bacterium]